MWSSYASLLGQMMYLRAKYGSVQLWHVSSDSITLKWGGFRLSKVQWGDKFYTKPGQVCEILDRQHRRGGAGIECGSKQGNRDRTVKGICECVDGEQTSQKKS